MADTHPTTDPVVYRERLLNVARALREDPDPSNFSMRTFGKCRTPACALGHYASRRDLQQAFYLRRDGWLGMKDSSGKRGREARGIDDPFVHEHFGINHAESDDLFGRSGCGGALAPFQAADYIEAFVASKYPVSI